MSFEDDRQIHWKKFFRWNFSIQSCFYCLKSSEIWVSLKKNIEKRNYYIKKLIWMNRSYLSFAQLLKIISKINLIKKIMWWIKIIWKHTAKFTEFPLFPRWEVPVPGGKLPRRFSTFSAWEWVKTSLGKEYCRWKICARSFSYFPYNTGPVLLHNATCLFSDAKLLIGIQTFHVFIYFYSRNIFFII